MAGIDNEVLYGSNVDFRGVEPVIGQMTANGQLLIGSAVAPFIRVANLTSNDGSVTITNGAGTIDLAAAGSGDVVGPASSTDNALARFDGTTGKLIQNSVGILSDAGNLSGLNAIYVANGALNAPSYSFTSETKAGMFWDGAVISFQAGESGATWLSGNFFNMSVGALNTYMPYLTLQSGISYTYTDPSSYPYAATHDDYFISVNTASARTINLPNAPTTDQVFIVKDRTGGAGANNITVTTPGGAVLLDGATTYVMNVNYGSASFIFNGTGYEVF